MDWQERIAEYRGIKKENVFLGVGSDEAIDNVMRVFCAPGKDSVLLLPPTYGMYKVLANTNDLNIVSVPLTTDFQLDMEKVISIFLFVGFSANICFFVSFLAFLFDQVEKAIQENPSIKMIFLCSPNNPTANDLNREDLLAVIRNNPTKIVVMDEAYVDFSENGSLAPLVETYPNLVIIQTLSKAFGLAGVR
jgi:histidinol-phosphate aminotransferase